MILCEDNTIEFNELMRSTMKVYLNKLERFTDKVQRIQEQTNTMKK